MAENVHSSVIPRQELCCSHCWELLGSGHGDAGGPSTNMEWYSLLLLAKNVNSPALAGNTDGPDSAGRVSVCFSLALIEKDCTKASELHADSFYKHL